MADVLIRPVEQGDIEELAAYMRQADIDEVAACGHTPIGALEMSVPRSSQAHTALIGDKMAAIFGVVPLSLLGGIGSPWMLGTDLVASNPGAFMKESASYIRNMLEAYPHLFNFVDARNAKAIRWLRRAGFTLHASVPHGPFGMPFHPFEMKA